MAVSWADSAIQTPFCNTNTSVNRSTAITLPSWMRVLTPWITAVSPATLNVLTPEAEGQRWFELHPKDGFFVPEGVQHQYHNVSGGVVELLFGIAPTYRAPA